MRLQLSGSVQRVRLASFLLLNDRLSGVMYVALSSEGEEQVLATHSWGGPLEVRDTMFSLVLSLPPSSMPTSSSPPASPEHPVVQAEKGR